MKTTRRAGSPALIMTAVVILSLFAGACSTEGVLPPQTGVFAPLGTTRFVLDDPRGLVIQAWYPAFGPGDGVLDPVIDQKTARAFVKFLPIGKDFLQNGLTSRSFVDAPIAADRGPYPVILFDHGFEGYEKQNMTQMEELASHGYIVFSFNHPGESFVTVYPDGTVTGIDSEIYPSLSDRNRKVAEANARDMDRFVGMIREAETSREKIEVMRFLSSQPRITTLARPIRERTEDVLNFMERMPALNAEGFFAGTLDLDRVGMYGHSMGGNVTHAVSSREDWPVNLRAAANLDGPQLIFPGEPVTIPTVPFLMCYSTGTYVGGAVIDLTGANDWVLNESDRETWRAVFHGTTHLNYSDLTYFSALQGSSIGRIDGTAMGIALNGLLVNWFDRHVKGQEVDMLALKASYDKWTLSVRLPPE